MGVVNNCATFIQARRLFEGGVYSFIANITAAFIQGWYLIEEIRYIYLYV